MCWVWRGCFNTFPSGCRLRTLCVCAPDARVCDWYKTSGGVSAGRIRRVYCMPVCTRRGTIGTGQEAHVTLMGEEGKSMRFALSAPVQGEQCPLSLGPIEQDSLPFDVEGGRVPVHSFYQRLPALKKITMPCGHSFGALSLVYHMARNDMRCPCCRSGVDERLRATSLPVHLSALVCAKVRQDDACDAAQQETEDRRVAELLQSQLSGNGQWDGLRRVTASDLTVCLWVYWSRNGVPSVSDEALGVLDMTAVIYDTDNGLIVLQSDYMHGILPGTMRLASALSRDNDAPHESVTPPFPVRGSSEDPYCVPFTSEAHSGYLRVTQSTRGVFQIEELYPAGGAAGSDQSVSIRVVWYTEARPLLDAHAARLSVSA